MKTKLVMLLACLAFGLTALNAQPKERGPRMSKEEFDRKLESFITEHADLTEQEAAAFFPLYQECQKKKHELNGRIWKRHREARGKELSEEEYRQILEEVANLRVQVDELDKVYLADYHKVLSYKKIFDVQAAESRFHRELLKECAPGERPKRPRK